MEATGKPRQPSPTMVLKIIYFYMIAMHIILPVLVFFLYKPAEGSSHSFAIGNLFPSDFSLSINLAAYGFGLMTFIAGFIVPRIIGRRGAAKIVTIMAHGNLNEGSPVTQSIAPYMLRLVLFEATTLCGFVVAFWSETPQYIIPFTVLGLCGAFFSPPTEDFVKSMTE